MKPATTNFDSPTSVSRIIFILRSAASVFHVAPYAISICRRHAMCTCWMLSLHSLYMETPARLRATTTKITPAKNFVCAANTQTSPTGFIFSGVGVRLYCKTAIDTASKINANLFRHGILRRCSEKLGVEGSRKLLFGLKSLSTGIVNHELRYL